MNEAIQINANKKAQKKVHAGRVISAATFTWETVTAGVETATIELDTKVVDIVGVYWLVDCDPPLEVNLILLLPVFVLFSMIELGVFLVVWEP